MPLNLNNFFGVNLFDNFTQRSFFSSQNGKKLGHNILTKSEVYL